MRGAAYPVPVATRLDPASTYRRTKPRERFVGVVITVVVHPVTDLVGVGVNLDGVVVTVFALGDLIRPESLA